MTRWTRTKAMLAILFAGALLAALLTSGASQERPGAAPPQEVAAPVRKEEPAAEPTREVRVRVVDPEGRPLPGADIHVSVWTDEKGFKRNRDLPTDDEGVARVELPKQYSIVRLWASKKPLVSLFANWERAELASGQRLPAVYTFRLERAASAAGRILDTAGRPVSGARVQVELADGPAPAAADHRVSYNPWLASGSDAATTDADGRWKIDNVPDRPGVELRLLVTHPDFVPENESSRGTAQALREGTAALSLRPGVIVRGRVTDADGRPVQDAVLIHGDDPYHEQTTSKVAADSTGRYRLPALPTGPTSVTVLAPGFAPLLRKVDLQPGLPDQDFRLAPGKPVRLRIVNGAGRPIPPARVWLMEWNGSKSVYTDHNPNHPKVPDSGIPRQADAQGVWHWPSAPDGPVTVHVFANGFASQDLEVTGGAAERTVRLKAEHRISGAVTDAVSGRPIPAFSVIPVDVFAKNHLSTERFNAVAGRDGRLDFLASRTDIPLRLRVEAAGYRTQDGPEFRVGDDTSRRQDFRLAPSPPRTGRVVDAAGTPVAGAEVLLATPTETARMSDTRDNHRALTDASGRFEFPDPGEPWAVLVRSDSGVASAALAPDRADAGTLALRPWASLRGTFSDAGRPVSRATVFVHPVRLAAAGQPRLDDALQTVTGPDGTFAFPQVPPGPVCVRVHLGPWQDEGFRSAPSVPLELRPGERAQLALGSGGATLTGRVRLTGMVPAGLDCTYSLNHLVRREAGIAPPAEVAAAGFDVRHGWRQAWEKTPEGHTYLSTLHSWFVKLAPDGSFRVSGVPPGEYDLSVAVYGKPNGCLIDPLARRVVRVAVTAADAARGEVALPDTMAEVVPVPAVGDTPDLSFARPDGTSGVLAEFRGKPIVLHFWASWCLSCKAQLPALKALHQRFPDRGVAVLGLALDEDPAAWHAALESLQLPWAQGRAAASRVPGVSSVPAYWLLDPAGRIVAKTYDVDELARALDDVVK